VATGPGQSLDQALRPKPSKFVAHAPLTFQHARNLGAVGGGGVQHLHGLGALQADATEAEGAVEAGRQVWLGLGLHPVHHVDAEARPRHFVAGKVRRALAVQLATAVVGRVFAVPAFALHAHTRSSLTVKRQDLTPSLCRELTCFGLAREMTGDHVLHTFIGQIDA
jgi:hypothetical protein